EMRADPAVERRVRAGLAQRAGIAFIGVERDAILAEHRRLGRQRPLLLEGFSQLAGCNLAGLDVRLVEWIDLEPGARDRGGHLPAEEFLGELVGPRERDAHDRLPGLLERSNRRILGAVRR